MKIFHGLGNINGSAACLARAERELGLDSYCVGYRDKGPKTTPDFFCKSSIYPPYSYQEFKYFSNLFDIFVFYGLYSFAGSSLADIPLLKKMGKKIIFYFRGCDIRDSSLATKHNPNGMCANCWPQTCEITPIHREIIHTYADEIWVSTKDLLLSEKTARYIPQAVDINSLSFSFAPYTGGTFNLVHSPSRPYLKGSTHIQKAIENLQKVGVPITLTLLTGLPWEVAQEKSLRAHIAIDQLMSGWYGVAAVEYLAQGKPTFCYLDHDFLNGENIPILNTNTISFASDLHFFLSHPENWYDMAVRGRKYVEEKHHCLNIAKITKEIYTNI